MRTYGVSIWVCDGLSGLNALSQAQSQIRVQGTAKRGQKKVKIKRDNKECIKRLISYWTVGPKFVIIEKCNDVNRKVITSLAYEISFQSEKRLNKQHRKATTAHKLID